MEFDWTREQFDFRRELAGVLDHLVGPDIDCWDFPEKELG